jgi:hypothetical protein
MTTQVNSTVLGTLGNLTVTGNLSANTVSAWALGGIITTASQTNITGVGNLTAGTWSASTITPNRGGTGLTASGNSGNVLTSNGTAWTSSPSTTTGAGTLTASGQTFTITTGAKGKCLINLSSSYVATYGSWGTCVARLVIGGVTVASDSAYTMEYGSRVSGDHAIIAYQYSGNDSESVTVTFTTTFPGAFNKAFYSFIGT